MKIFRITAFALLFLAINACSGNGPKKNAAASEIVPGPDMPINIQKEGEYESVVQIRHQAAAILEHRTQNDPDPLAMVTAPYWIWGGFFDGKTMIHPKELTGQWLKFEDDFTYSYGWYDDVNGTGRYHYRLDDQSMIMLDDNEDLQPKEWQLQSNGVAIVLIGRHGFQVNNGMQMKLAPRDFRPSRGKS